MPTRGTVAIETMLCLRHHLDGYPKKLLTVSRKPVVEARNHLAKEARALCATELPFEPLIFWVDSDMWWPAGHVHKAVTILKDNPDVDMVVGHYSLRMTGGLPNYFTFDGDEFTVPEYTGLCPDIERVYAPSDYKDGELTRLALGEPGWAILRPELLDRVGDDPFNRLRISKDFPEFTRCEREYLSEGDSFYIRANHVGAKIVIERTLLVGHVDTDNGLMYFPCTEPRYAEGLLVPTRKGPVVDGAHRTYL